MTANQHGVAMASEHQAQVESVAGRLRELLEVDLSTHEVVKAILNARQVKQNKATLLRFQKEVFNGHDWSIETLSRNLTEDFVDHAAMVGDPPGLEGVQMRFSAWASAFDDSEEDNIAMVGEGDMLAVLYDLHAKHIGEFMGVEPSNREVVIPGIEFVRVRDGKIAEHWGIYDFLTTAEEIGANLTFVPRADAGEPARPEIPWRRELRPQDAKRAADAAANYLRSQQPSQERAEPQQP